MPEVLHRYIIEFHSESGSPLGQVSVSADFAPALEWTRLAGVRSGRIAFAEYDSPASVLPLWHVRLSRPYVQGFRVRLDTEAGGSFCCDFSNGYFKSLVTCASALLVEAGKLEAGDRFIYLITAYPGEPDEADANSGRFAIQDVAPVIPVKESALSGYVHSSAAQGYFEDGLFPVYIPGRVLTEVTSLTQEAQQIETGGFLIGHLHHDAAAPEVFVEVTAQVPAAGTVGEKSRLRFTSDSWTAARNAIVLRHKGEILLGWWHSHPVKHWTCKDCPPEKQKVCELSRGFLSEHDRTLHRTVFSRAWCIAMVASDVSYGNPTLSVFGWNRGILEPRSYYTLESRDPEQNQLSAPEDGSGLAAYAGGG